MNGRRQYYSPLTTETLTHIVTTREYVSWPLGYIQGYRNELKYDAGRLPKVERRPPMLIQR